MNVRVNGKPAVLPEESTVASLMENLKLGPRGVAVEVNEQLVVRKDWAATSLREGDRIEIVTLVGGG